MESASNESTNDFLGSIDKLVAVIKKIDCQTVLYEVYNTLLFEPETYLDTLDIIESEFLSSSNNVTQGMGLELLSGSLETKEVRAVLERTKPIFSNHSDSDIREYFLELLASIPQ